MYQKILYILLIVPIGKRDTSSQTYNNLLALTDENDAIDFPLQDQQLAAFKGCICANQIIHFYVGCLNEKLFV